MAGTSCGNIYKHQTLTRNHETNSNTLFRRFSSSGTCMNELLCDAGGVLLHSAIDVLYLQFVKDATDMLSTKCTVSTLLIKRF